MKNTKYLAISLILACPFIFGQPGPHPGGHFFDLHDANEDGQVTADEFLNQAQSRFDQMDENGDGVITQSDFDERMFNMVASHMVLRADADESGSVTADEWSTYVDALETDESGVVDPGQFSRRHRGFRGGGMRCAGAPLDLNSNDALDVEDLAQIFDILDQNDDQIVGEDELAEGGPRRGGRDGMGKRNRMGHGGRFGRHGRH